MANSHPFLQTWILQTEAWDYTLLGWPSIQELRKKGTGHQTFSGGKKGASVGSLREESFVPGVQPQPRMSPSARQGVIPASGLVGTSETSCWLLTHRECWPNIWPDYRYPQIHVALFAEEWVQVKSSMSLLLENGFSSLPHHFWLSYCLFFLAPLPSHSSLLTQSVKSKRCSSASMS